MNFNEKSVSKKKKALTFYTMRRKGKVYLFLFKTVLIGFLAIFLAFCGLTLGFMQALYHDTPPVTIESLKIPESLSILYDNQGEQILSMDNSYFQQEYTSLNRIPQDLQNAVIAMMELMAIA